MGIEKQTRFEFQGNRLVCFFEPDLCGLNLGEHKAVDGIRHNECSVVSHPCVLNPRRRGERIGRRDKRSEKFQVRPRDRFWVQHRSQWGKEVIPNDGLVEVRVDGRREQSASRLRDLSAGVLEMSGVVSPAVVGLLVGDRYQTTPDTHQEAEKI